MSKQVTPEADSVIYTDALQLHTLKPANSNGIVKPKQHISNPADILSWKYVD